MNSVFKEKIPEVINPKRGFTIYFNPARVVYDKRPAILERIRLKIIRILGGVDRQSCRDFCKDYLIPNGNSAVTGIGQELILVDEKIEYTKEQELVAVAPWVESFILQGCEFREVSKAYQAAKQIKVKGNKMNWEMYKGP